MVQSQVCDDFFCLKILIIQENRNYCDYYFLSAASDDLAYSWIQKWPLFDAAKKFDETSHHWAPNETQNTSESSDDWIFDTDGHYNEATLYDESELAEPKSSFIKKETVRKTII